MEFLGMLIAEHLLGQSDDVVPRTLLSPVARSASLNGSKFCWALMASRSRSALETSALGAPRTWLDLLSARPGRD